MQKTGMNWLERLSIYHTLLRMSRPRFWMMILLFYTSVNILFAGIYFAVGVDQLAGGSLGDSTFNKFMKAFFFSSQTLTTVGYGHVSPDSMLTNLIASTEAFMGILAFAVVTGLVYGRFTRPKAFIIFSDNMLIAPYRDGRGLMFRLVTYKNNHLTDAEAVVTAAMHIVENGKKVTKFYPLTLEISKINSLALNWTIVHHLNEESPLYGFSKGEILASRLELIVSIKAFDDHFSNTVQQRTSYNINELVYGARFLSMYDRSETGGTTILKLDMVNAHEPAHLPEYHEETLSANT
jgi:inward rectifier potassium channel